MKGKDLFYGAAQTVVETDTEFRQFSAKGCPLHYDLGLNYWQDINIQRSTSIMMHQGYYYRG